MWPNGRRALHWIICYLTSRGIQCIKHAIVFLLEVQCFQQLSQWNCAVKWETLMVVTSGHVETMLWSSTRKSWSFQGRMLPSSLPPGTLFANTHKFLSLFSSLSLLCFRNYSLSYSIFITLHACRIQECRTGWDVLHDHLLSCATLLHQSIHKLLTPCCNWLDCFILLLKAEDYSRNSLLWQGLLPSNFPARLHPFLWTASSLLCKADEFWIKVEFFSLWDFFLLISLF